VSKRVKKKKQATTAATIPTLPPESRRAEVATIGWLLSALFTVAAELVGMGSKLYFIFTPNPPQDMAVLAILPGMTLQMALTTSMIGLLLLPMVYAWRVTPPPTVVTIVLVLISLAPIARFIILYSR
jgi:hypothetical protein